MGSRQSRQISTTTAGLVELFMRDTAHLEFMSSGEERICETKLAPGILAFVDRTVN